MISHFPPLYKDELFYSVLARYHQRSGNDSSKETLRDLFGKSSNTAISDFSGDLSLLCQRIGSDNYNPIDIIRYHTLLPYFIPFISQEHGEKQINQMTSGQNAVSVALGLAASTVKETNNFRFCRKCFDEETAIVGEAYWHRAHQLPGVLICHKHKGSLIESNIPYRNKANKHNLIPLDEKAIKYGKEILFPENYLNPLVFISEQSYRLLNDGNLLRSTKLIRELYLSKLYRRGYITNSNRLRLKKLVPDFLRFFESGFLNFLESDFGENVSDNWFLKGLRKPRVSCHPLRHLLIMMFIEEVIPVEATDEMRIHPFGASPWPCLNKVCNHYKSFTINICEVTTDSKTRKPVGTFICRHCNFTYSRRGPDLVKKDKYKIGRVKKFGEVWLNKLYELNSNREYSIRRIASYLDIDSKTVKRYLEAKSTVNAPKLCEHNNISEKNMKAFLAIRENKPGLSRTELRREVPALYMWLYRNEKEWLLNNLPLAKKPVKTKSRIDWASRDEEYSFLIIKETVNILIEIPLTRVTKTKIAKKLDLLAKFEKSITKVPNSQKILEDVTETTEEFQIRRIRYFAAKFRIDNIPYSKSSLARVAGIKNEFIQNKVDLVLKEETSYFKL
ncbi:TnsD family transposase [Bacillus tianshenii]|uniref:TnsD family Tn7-like transposition protein n=1 Tax=Sutcliffiella tianshenii TaxID=1463404 RepID=UPI001CD3E4BD|nr:TnsD family Tn7-like transposition protein [Bacillus tianshenii]MCA1321979.1 TnsD family transposase [Bacillus tianshenii]